MRALATAVSASVALHLLLLFLAHRAEEPLKRAHRKKVIAVLVHEAQKAKPKPPTPPPVITPVRITHSMPKRVTPKPLLPSPAPPPPSAPPPPPQGFSVATKSTVAESGTAVAAKENGGNAFADPQSGLPAGDKIVTRPPPPPPPLEPAQWLTDAIDRSPPYPAAALRANIEGQVLLRVCVATTGNVESVTVLKGLGFGCDEAAAEWAKKRWHFRPAHRGGTAVPTCMLQPMRFQLQH